MLTRIIWITQEEQQFQRNKGLPVSFLGVIFDSQQETTQDQERRG